jgi:hypothetical protein
VGYINEDENRERYDHLNQFKDIEEDEYINQHEYKERFGKSK